MITTLLLSLPLFSAPEAPVPSQAEAAISWRVEDLKEEYKRRREAANDDEDALWDLYEWCKENDLGKEGRSCLRRILKLSPNHKRANEGLGYLFYDGKWFKNQKKLDQYKAAEEKRKAEEEGLVRWKDEWVPAEDLPYLQKGLTKDLHGEWVDAELKRRQEEGWVQQDLVWVSPEEKGKIAEGLWKVGEEWLSLEDANKKHAQLDSMWIIPTEHFLLHTTCDREVATEAAQKMERAYKDLAKIFGTAPKEREPVFLLRSPKQYGLFAAGRDGERPATETHGLSSVHLAYYGDLIFLPKGEIVAWSPAGVGYWDAEDPNGAQWGNMSARHAAGHSFVEGIDTSPKAKEKFVKGGSESLNDRDLRAFYREKRVPEWFRTAAVTYAERYYVDAFVAAGGDPHWTRAWSIQNILNKGGLDSIEDILKAKIDSGDPDRSARIMNQLGLVMAFIVDGKNPKLIEAHGAAKAALKADGDPKAAFEALETALKANEPAFREFAGL